MRKNFLLSLGLSCLLFSNGTAPLFAEWTEPAVISTTPSSINPTPQNLAIDGHSNAIIGWLAGTIGVDNDLYTATLPGAATAWNAPTPLYTGSSPEFASFPLIFSDNQGTVYAIWANFYLTETSFDHTTAITSTEGILDNLWQPPIAATTLEGFLNGGIASVDTLGNRIAILELAENSSSSSPPYSIYMMALAAEATEWTTPSLLDIDESSLSGPIAFAVASEGTAVIGWKINPELTLKSARYAFETDTLTPLNTILLPTNAVDVGFIKSVIGPHGDVTLVFSARIGTSANYILFSSFLPAGGDTWTYPTMISNPDNTTTPLYLSIDMDKNSNTFIVWGEVNTSNEAFVRTAILPFGGTLSTITDLASAVAINEGETSCAGVSVDAFGNAVATWNQIIEGVSEVQVSSYEIGGSWTEAETMTTTGYIPRIVLSDQGTAVATWVDTTTHYIYGSSNNIFSLNAPQSFGGYITVDEPTCTLNMHWSPSLAPNIISYEIYRGEMLIANVSGSGPFTVSYPIDCSFVEGDYSIVAVGSNGNTSVPVGLVLAY